MTRINELKVIWEGDFVLNFDDVRRDRVLLYGMSDYVETPLGKIRLSFDVVSLKRILDSVYDFDVWYPNLHLNTDYISLGYSSSGSSTPSALFADRRYISPKKLIIYEASESGRNRFWYKWVWVIPVRLYDDVRGMYVNSDRAAVLVADLRFGLPEYNNSDVPVLHLKLYEPVPIDLLKGDGMHSEAEEAAKDVSVSEA